MTKPPFDHIVDEEKKVVYIYWGDNGQIGRYGIPHYMKKFYPGYTHKFSTKGEN
jgi:hypothetical protein